MHEVLVVSSVVFPLQRVERVAVALASPELFDVVVTTRESPEETCIRVSAPPGVTSNGMALKIGRAISQCMPGDVVLVGDRGKVSTIASTSAKQEKSACEPIGAEEV